jgi:protein pelota
MRIRSNFSEIKQDCPGKLTIIIDTADDLWHFYNVLFRGDLIQIKTTRKITKEGTGGNKSVKKEYIFLTLKVETFEYDAEGNEIRFKGKNVSENEYLSMGQYHSASIKKGVQFSVIKKSWDQFSINKISEASNPTMTSDLAVCLMEEGVANIFLVSSHITVCKAKIELSIPKKRKGASQHDKSLEKFFGYVLEALLKHINFDIVKCLVIGSPGFVKDQFSAYVNDRLTGNLVEYDIIRKNIKKFFYAHSSSSYKHSLNELLSKPDVLKQVGETKAAEDITYMSKFDKILSTDYEKVVFGMKQIQIAIDSKAIDFLLVTDDYLRKIGPVKRKELQSKFDSIEKEGGVVKNMSSMHPTGVRVNNLGGITAVVKFIVPDLENFDEDYNEHLQEENNDEDNDKDEEMLKDLVMECDLEEEYENEVDELRSNVKPSKDELKERDLIKKKSFNRKRSEANDFLDDL